MHPGMHTQTPSWCQAHCLPGTGQFPCPHSGPGLDLRVAGDALLHVAGMGLCETGLEELGMREKATFLPSADSQEVTKPLPRPAVAQA